MSAPLQMFVIHAPDYATEGTFERRMSVLPTHHVRMKELIGAGTVVSGGFMISPESVLPGVQESDRKLVGSMFVVNVPNIEAAKETVEGDQYWIHNVWDRERLSILPFIQVAPPPSSS